MKNILIVIFLILISLLLLSFIRITFGNSRTIFDGSDESYKGSLQSIHSQLSYNEDDDLVDNKYVGKDYDNTKQRVPKNLLN